MKPKMKKAITIKTSLLFCVKIMHVKKDAANTAPKKQLFKINIAE